ncbi:Mitochondrial copper homeostasis protein [Cytospora paraplurivora]|uniref:Mitochondrial copper homeostasis protein n=1 Tax=Cytospora paraplurivora TaxID=2898453 RepID=A0AAN9U0Z3_9PEZI
MPDSADKTTGKPAEAVDHWDEKTKKQFNGKSRSEWFDPCQEAANKSFKCLNRNGGDRALCQDYFQYVIK